MNALSRYAGYDILTINENMQIWAVVVMENTKAAEAPELVFGGRGGLKGKHVLFIGRPVKCKRRDQVAFVELAGGLCQNRVNGKTDIIVLAEGITRESRQCRNAEFVRGDGTLLVVCEDDFQRVMDSTK